MRRVIPKKAKLVPKDAKLVFKGNIFDTYQWQQKMFDNSYETFEMLRRPDTIKAIAIKDDKIIILEQQQPDTDLFYDLPGGRHDVETEDELDAAKRELLEETGLSFKSWKLLDVTQPHTKIEQFVYIFLATDFEKQDVQHLDSGEKIEVQYYGFDEAKRLCNDPKSRYLPKELFDQVNSLEELINLPEYQS